MYLKRERENRSWFLRCRNGYAVEVFLGVFTLLNLKDRERGFCLVMLKDVSRDVLFAFILIGIPGNRENDCVCVCVCERERERERELAYQG
jgi:hypothetical protein